MHCLIPGVLLSVFKLIHVAATGELSSGRDRQDPGGPGGRLGALGTSVVCWFCLPLPVFLALKKRKKNFLKTWSFNLFGYKCLSFLPKEMKTHIAM